MDRKKRIRRDVKKMKMRLRRRRERIGSKGLGSRG